MLLLLTLVAAATPLVVSDGKTVDVSVPAQQTLRLHFPEPAREIEPPPARTRRAWGWAISTGKDGHTILELTPSTHPLTAQIVFVGRSRRALTVSLATGPQGRTGDVQVVFGSAPASAPSPPSKPPALDERTVRATTVGDTLVLENVGRDKYESIEVAVAAADQRIHRGTAPGPLEAGKKLVLPFARLAPAVPPGFAPERIQLRATGPGGVTLESPLLTIGSTPKTAPAPKPAPTPFATPIPTPQPSPTPFATPAPSSASVPREIVFEDEVGTTSAATRPVPSPDSTPRPTPSPAPTASAVSAPTAVDSPRPSDTTTTPGLVDVEDLVAAVPRTINRRVVVAGHPDMRAEVLLLGNRWTWARLILVGGSTRTVASVTWRRGRESGPVIHWRAEVAGKDLRITLQLPPGEGRTDVAVQIVGGARYEVPLHRPGLADIKDRIF